MSSPTSYLIHKNRPNPNRASNAVVHEAQIKKMFNNIAEKPYLYDRLKEMAREDPVSAKLLRIYDKQMNPFIF